MALRSGMENENSPAVKLIMLSKWLTDIKFSNLLIYNATWMMHCILDDAKVKRMKNR